MNKAVFPEIAGEYTDKISLQRVGWRIQSVLLIMTKKDS